MSAPRRQHRYPWPVLVVAAVVTTAVGPGGALAQAEGECLERLDALEAAGTREPDSTWEAIDAQCRVEHESWLAERSGYDAPTRAWVDATMAVQSSRWASARALLDGDCVGALQVLSELAHALPELPEEARADFAVASRAAFVCAPAAAPAEVSVPVVDDAIIELAGTSGGPHDAHRFGMPCEGHIPEEPSHVVDVTSEQRVSVVATATEAGNLSLVMTGPGGTYCDDDTYGLNPALSERLTPGRYAIFVGETSAPGRTTAYRLFVASQALPSLQTGTTPRVAAVAWPPPGGAVRHIGRSEGFFNAELLGPECLGRLGEQPDFRLDLGDHARVSIEVTPDARDDLTLVVAGRDRVVCNDDHVDHDPAVSTFLPPGQYDVWVGRRDDRPASFTARFSAEDLFGVEPGVLTPLFDTGSLGAGQASLWLSGVVVGEERADGRFGPLCDGFIAYHPSHTLYLEEPADVWLEASPGSASVPGHAGTNFATGDLTMTVTGPGGTFCSDDVRGRDPVIAEHLAAGTYDIYVGEAELTPVGTAYGVRATLSQPLRGIERPPRVLTLGADDGTWRTWGRTFGEQAAAGVLGATCSGELPARPSLELTLTEEAQVTVRVASGPLGAPVLGLAGPSGTLCADTESSLQPTIDERLAPGRYDLFVGESLGTALGTPFALAIETRAADSRLDESEPDAGTTSPPDDLEGETIELSLDASFGIGGVPGVSGGPRPGRLYGPSCVGHLPSTPQVVARVTEPNIYRFAVVAADDTTLVIDGPGGPYCNDDTVDFNPVVETWLEPGVYSVYVGSYSSGLRHEFSMFIARYEASP